MKATAFGTNCIVVHRPITPRQLVKAAADPDALGRHHLATWSVLREGDPEITLKTVGSSPEDNARLIIKYLEDKGFLQKEKAGEN